MSSCSVLHLLEALRGSRKALHTRSVTVWENVRLFSKRSQYPPWHADSICAWLLEHPTKASLQARTKRFTLRYPCLHVGCIGIANGLTKIEHFDVVGCSQAFLHLCHVKEPRRMMVKLRAKIETHHTLGKLTGTKLLRAKPAHQSDCAFAPIAGFWGFTKAAMRSIKRVSAHVSSDARSRCCCFCCIVRRLFCSSGICATNSPEPALFMGADTVRRTIEAMLISLVLVGDLGSGAGKMDHCDARSRDSRLSVSRSVSPLYLNVSASRDKGIVPRIAPIPSRLPGKGRCTVTYAWSICIECRRMSPHYARIGRLHPRWPSKGTLSPGSQLSLGS